MRRFSWCLLVAIMVTTPLVTNAQVPLLEGTSWQVAGEPEMGRRFISFAGEGRFSGFAGCNRIRGRYEIRDGLLTISNIGATRMACAPEVMGREAAFLDMLGNVRGAKVEHTVLRLLDESGGELGILEQRLP